MQQVFPVRGVVGVLAGSEAAVSAALRSFDGPAAQRPDAVEVRADLFDPPASAISALGRVPRGVPCIFTVRAAAHGGRFDGAEDDRLKLYREALSRGASLVDAEWDSAAARALARDGAPLVASHHDFTGMPDAREMERITKEMGALSSRAIKLVGTARRAADGARMLEWLAARPPNGPERIGFAMGELGYFSRVLSMAWGAPFTYAAWGAAVAPGQGSVADMRGLYRASRLGRSTRVLGVVGNPIAHSLSPWLHNPALARRGIDAVYLPFLLESFPELDELIGPLGITGLSVTIPFKEAALARADRADERSQTAGAANTLLFERHESPSPPSGDAGRPAPVRVAAYNTDFDGVLEPLCSRGIELRGLVAAIIGNGGAARGAARALKEAGARAILYARNPERGAAVAKNLGVESRPLAELRRGGQGLILNATPLGLHESDPSPAPREAFEARTVAFDMVYGSERTAFLEAARAAGSILIPGREMLIRQALAQFRLFTGLEAELSEFEESFLAGQRARQG
ncbi:MAG TPA: type I 3-dehydroquinate dehydratase [Planctomycetota bacterium]|nr:type I 3-dehydroquinate dehydratase [Planctomycetota bacterium]